MTDGTLYHLAAFSLGDTGGNPAGVWIGDALPEPDVMQQTAAEVGASETAFIAPTIGARRTVRYYSPEAEASFCGHATIASGAILGRRDGEGTYVFDTQVGAVEVLARQSDHGMRASLRSVDTGHKPISDAELQQALECLRWSCDDLDARIPPANAFAGAWHYVIAVGDRSTLAGLDYDYERLRRLMLQEGLTTLQLIWREHDALFHARNPFPVGGIVEDPATGAAAAALGGYLRDVGLVGPPFHFEIRQGEDMGTPSLIHVDVPAHGGITVSGTTRDL